MKKTKIILNLLSYLFIPFVVVILLIFCFRDNTSKTSKEQFLQTVKINIPASQEYDTTASANLNRVDVDEFIAAYYQAGRKGINIFKSKDAQDDLLITDEEFQIVNKRHFAQREKLINCVVGTYNKFGFTGAVIGLIGISVIIWFGIAIICEFIKYLILRFFGYVVSRLV